MNFIDLKALFQYYFNGSITVVTVDVIKQLTMDETKMEQGCQEILNKIYPTQNLIFDKVDFKLKK